MQGMLYVLHMVFVVARYESGVQFQFRESKMAEMKDGGQNGGKKRPFSIKNPTIHRNMASRAGNTSYFPLSALGDM